MPEQQDLLASAINTDDAASLKNAFDVVAWGGLVKPASESIPPNVFGYNHSVGQEPYDPAKAKALLAQAGFSNGFETTLGTSFGPFANNKAEEAMAGMEPKVGIKVTIDNMELAAYLQAFRSYTHPPMYYFGANWVPTMDAANSLQWFTSDHAGPDKFLNDPTFDQLFKQAQQEMNGDQRQKLLQQAEGILVQQDVGIWLRELPNIYALKQGLQGFQPRPDEIIDVSKMSWS